MHVKSSKVIEGVMVVKDGKGWGLEYDSPRCSVYGWQRLVDAIIVDSKYCKKTTDMTGHPSAYQLEGADLAFVRKTITVEIVNKEEPR